MNAQSKFQKGDSLDFENVSGRVAHIHGRRVLPGGRITVLLSRDWDDEEGLGEGGPWGWGGYQSRFVASLGEVEFHVPIGR